GKRASVEKFAQMPVVIVAYSGGYLTASYCLQVGGVKGRVQGVLLLDALYGGLDKFASWIANAKSSVRSPFFVSSFTSSTRRQNAELERILNERDITHGTTLDRQNWRSPTFLPTTDVRHRDFVTHAWAEHPIHD